mgnify:CR=1 FL=1
MKINYLFLLTLIYSSTGLLAQGNFNVKGFGSIEHEVEYYDNVQEPEFNWQLGEQSLFVTGDMGNKFSFLGEFSLAKGSHNHDIKANIHRVRIKYNYVGNHSLIIGQMHTPVNYWNDVYYHARIFFPTTDRPLAFSYFIPVHSIGIRAQGQNLGKLNFGYDIQTTNSLTGDGNNPAVLGAFHIKPVDGMRIGASYYYSFIANNNSMQHHGSGMMSSMYVGSLDYQLVSFSFARFEKKLEILNEFNAVLSRTDSLGAAQGFSNYLYVGYNFKELYTPYLLCDILRSPDNDLRNGAINKVKIGIGYKHQFTPLLNLKCQLERYMANPNWSNPAANNYEFTIQFSYAIY